MSKECLTDVLVKRILALLKRDIRARIHHGWANSLVEVRDTTHHSHQLLKSHGDHGVNSDTSLKQLLSEESQMTPVEPSRR